MKDRCYALLFDKKDQQMLYDYAKKIRETHDQSLVDDFNNLAELRWNDHKDVSLNGSKPIQGDKASDLVTSPGITQMINQFQQLAGGTTRWKYMGYGRLLPPVAPATTSDPLIQPTAADTTLQNEPGPPDHPRVDMTAEGWIEYTSTSLRFGAIFGEGRPDVGVAEAGIFTALTGGIMLNRNVFDNADIWHKQFVSVFVLSSIIEFVPVV